MRFGFDFFKCFCVSWIVLVDSSNFFSSYHACLIFVCLIHTYLYFILSGKSLKNSYSEQLSVMAELSSAAFFFFIFFFNIVWVIFWLVKNSGTAKFSNFGFLQVVSVQLASGFSLRLEACRCMLAFVSKRCYALGRVYGFLFGSSIELTFSCGILFYGVNFYFISVSISRVCPIPSINHAKKRS